MISLLTNGLNFLNWLVKPHLTNIQRLQALFVIGLGSWMILPHPALAQLSNGAGQLTNNQCSQGFWFLRDINTHIANTLGGLGGADDGLCRIINIFVLGSVILVIGMILWATGDHLGNQTPLRKAFSPFLGWITGIVVIWMVIGITFFGSGTAGNSGGVI